MQFDLWSWGCLIRWSAGPLIRWSADPLIRWSADPLIRWSADPLVRWSADPLIRWSADPLVRWSADPLVRWSADPLVRWSADPLIRWSADPLIRWSAGPLIRLIRWSAGPLVRWSADQLIRSPVLFSWPADRDLTAHWGRLSSRQSAASTTFSHCYRPWPLKWEIPTTSRKSVPPLSLRKSRTLDNIRLQASSQAKSMKQEVCSTSDCGRPSWPTLPARLSAQVFCHQDAQEEGGLDGEEMPRQSRQGRCIAWKIWKSWVSTCLVKMDDNRTGASCQLQAAALLNPTSVGSWHHPTQDQCAQAACLSHPPWLALHGALPSSQLLCP